MIHFKRHIEKAEFVLPGESTPFCQQIEWREDPLTHRTSVLSDGLINKTRILFGETDRDLLRETADRTREHCLFCPERVYEVTPTFPTAWMDGGRLIGEASILFPNIFPLSGIHAVLTWPGHHYLDLTQFTPSRLHDLFHLACRFIQIIAQKQPDIRFISLNGNHLQPAGASVFHPHFQVVGGRVYPHLTAALNQAAQGFKDQTGVSFWDALIETEQASGERFVCRRGRWAVLTAFAPQGSNEIVIIHDSEQSPFRISVEDFHDLAVILSHILHFLGVEGYSTFNFSLTGDDPGGNGRCIARIITRQNFRSMYRTDDYFLQKLLGAELTIVAPEVLAARLRKHFTG